MFSKTFSDIIKLADWAVVKIQVRELNPCLAHKKKTKNKKKIEVNGVKYNASPIPAVPLADISFPKKCCALYIMFIVMKEPGEFLIYKDITKSNVHLFLYVY